MTFPIQRGRRLRYNPAVRRLVRETRFAPSQLIHPLFVRPGNGEQIEIPSMPWPGSLPGEDKQPLRLFGQAYCTTLAAARASAGAIRGLQKGSIGVRSLQEIHARMAATDA